MELALPQNKPLMAPEPPKPFSSGPILREVESICLWNSVVCPVIRSTREGVEIGVA